ncbi:MAG: hypothetical protein IPH74_02840 [Bacteroidetes bacterium]|nr:hypothetical protein [Bacteroidota bacterium]
MYIGYDTIKKWWKITGSALKLGEVPLYITTSKPITNIKREGFNESKKLEEVSLLLQNSNGVFVDNGINLSNTTNAFAAFSVVSGDFDNDMDIDIYLNASTTVQNLPNTYFQNQGNGIFVVDTTGAVQAVMMLGMVVLYLQWILIMMDFGFVVVRKWRRAKVF